MIVLDVLGTPASKGSGRAVMSGGKARFLAGSTKAGGEKIASWEGLVREAARAAVGDVAVPPFVDIAIAVTIVFRMARPPGHWGKGKNAGKLTPTAPDMPRSAPDIDKLARCTIDPLTGTVIDDDARIVQLVCVKEYAAPGQEGARIIVEQWKGYWTEEEQAASEAVRIRELEREIERLLEELATARRLGGK